MKFALTEEQLARSWVWLKEQEKRVFGDEAPYYGASGGCLTYTFTPTGLGIVETVEYMKGTEYEAVLDLTDYDHW